MQRPSTAFIESVVQLPTSARSDLVCPRHSQFTPRAHPPHGQRASEHHRLRLLQAQCPRRARRSIRLPSQNLGGCRRKQEAPLYPLISYVILAPPFSFLHCSAEASSGTGYMHKSKLNTNGSFSVGKTWLLSDLRGIQVSNVCLLLLLLSFYSSRLPKSP